MWTISASSRFSRAARARTRDCGSPAPLPMKTRDPCRIRRTAWVAVSTLAAYRVCHSVSRTLLIVAPTLAPASLRASGHSAREWHLPGLWARVVCTAATQRRAWADGRPKPDHRRGSSRSSSLTPRIGNTAVDHDRAVLRSPGCRPETSMTSPAAYRCSLTTFGMTVVIVSGRRAVLVEHRFLGGIVEINYAEGPPTGLRSSCCTAAPRAGRAAMTSSSCSLRAGTSMRPTFGGTADLGGSQDGTT